MSKKNVLISFVTEAETDLQAISSLKALMFYLPENHAERFDVFEILDVEEVLL